MPAIAAPVLIEFTTNLLAGVGVPRSDAALVATSLVGANLRGHDSHGVMRVLQYVEFIEQGRSGSAWNFASSKKRPRWWCATANGGWAKSRRTDCWIC